MKTYEQYTDQQLTELLQENDHAAFIAIYDRYWAVLYAHAKKMTGESDDAMDIVQDIFTSLWHRSPELVFTVSLKAYLYTAVRNKTIKMLSRAKYRDAFIQDALKASDNFSVATDSMVRYNELARLVEREVSKLPPKMRMIFEKSRFEGLSHKHIAAELNVTEFTIKTTIYRALKILRTKLTSIPFILFFYFF